SALDNTGLLVAAGGVLTLGKDVSGTGAAHINNAGTIVAAGAFNENVQFGGTAGMLELAHSQAYAGKISGFSHAGGASLDLRDIHFVSPSEATFSGNASGGTLTVTDGTRTAKIKLVGDYTGSAFMAATDNNGGVTITDLGPHAVHGFVAAAAGTTGPADGAPSPPPPPSPALFAHHR
ncbi:MAG TPA: hypothetical protein VFE13_01305, partial [Caulobacteraceae bacterium]|nr:hypothetical protein [Caulobacteraceae bacterium]